MYRLAVEIQLKNGLLYQGVAVDLKINQQKQESLILAETVDVELEGSHHLLLSDLKSMRASVSNPHFDYVLFSE